MPLVTTLHTVLKEPDAHQRTWTVTQSRVGLWRMPRTKIAGRGPAPN
jgi:hypothetical protein